MAQNKVNIPVPDSSNSLPAAAHGPAPRQALCRANEQSIGKTVTARFSDGSIAFTGQAKTYLDVPSIGVMVDGHMRYWRADMCETHVDESPSPAASCDPAPSKIETGDTFEFMVRALREGAVTPEGLRNEAYHAIRFFIGMNERPIFSGASQDGGDWADPNGASFVRFSKQDLDSAVASERERCAKIAESTAVIGDLEDDQDVEIARIVAKIRSGE